MESFAKAKQTLISQLSPQMLEQVGCSSEANLLIDGLSQFMAHNQQVAEKQLLQNQLNLLHQLFPYLLTPMPSQGLAKINVNANLLAPTTLHAGTSLLVRHQQYHDLTYKTTNDVTVLPIELDNIKLSNAGEYQQLTLFFSAFSSIEQPLEQLDLHIDHFGNFLQSLTLFGELKQHTEQVMIAFDEQSETPCKVSFGSQDHEANLYNAHPLQKVRSVLHFAEKELFIRITPEQPQTNWSGFSVSFHLNPEWNPKPLPMKNSFHLFMVPIVNSHRDMALPVTVDGTKDKLLIQHPDTSSHLELQSILGLYIKTNNQLKPLLPGFLTKKSEQYEVVQPLGQANQHGFVRLAHPQAFSQHEKLFIDTLWYQRYESDLSHQARRVELTDEQLFGIDFNLQGKLSLSQTHPAANHLPTLMDILLLQNKAIDSLEQLKQLFYLLGIEQQAELLQLMNTLTRLECEKQQGMGGLNYRYTLHFTRINTEQRQLASYFKQFIGQILSLWLDAESVSVIIEK